MKYYVEYKFVNGDIKQTKKSDNFIQVMQKQSQILKKYKNELEYCVYKQEE